MNPCFKVCRAHRREELPVGLYTATTSPKRSYALPAASKSSSSSLSMIFINTSES